MSTPLSSWATSPATAKSMRANRARDTCAELQVRRILHRAGYRYRVDYRPSRRVRSRADIVFTRAKIAVYLDGCFWHGCPLHATLPKRNADYWVPKLTRNRERDMEVTDALTSEGWLVLRYWEHEAAPDVALRIIASVRARIGGDY